MRDRPCGNITAFLPRRFPPATQPQLEGLYQCWASLHPTSAVQRALQAISSARRPPPLPAQFTLVPYPFENKPHHS